ncbi:MAG TPA: MFS transporter [Dehalococcoidia bacterium]|nr:MFS transporter [Dehalococcoidia bacterium]
MQGSPSQYQANIWKYYLFHAFLNLQFWFPIWIIYLTEKRGLTLAEVTLIDVPFWLCIIALQIPGAAIADRYGRKPTLVAAATLFACAVIFFALASSFWLLLGSYLVWGVAFALLYGTESAFIYDSLKAAGREEEYSRIYGRGWAIAVGAQLVGTLAGAPLAGQTDLVFPILLSGGIASLAALVALSFREPLVVSATHHPTYGEIIRESAGVLRHQPEVRYAILFFGVITIGSVAPVFFFQPFLREHGVGLDEVGVWQTPMRIGGIVAALAAHRLISRLGERGTFYLMPLVLVPSYVLLAGWDSTYAQVAFTSINFAVILSQPTVTDYVNRRVPSEQRATVVSMTNLIRSLVLVPSAPLLGFIAEEISLRTAFLAAGGIVGVLSVPLLALWVPHLLRRPDVVPDALPAACPD